MASDIQSTIVQTAQNYGVDPSLALAIAQTESNFNPAAVSPKGAIGVFQLMPATAAGLNVNPYDPTQNITGGISYFASLLKKYNGDVQTALAAYNFGPGNVDKGASWPQETVNYVQKILGLAPSPSADSVDAGSSPDVAPDGSQPDLTLVYVAGGLLVGAVLLSFLSPD